MKNITLLGLYNEANTGDLVIADCTEYLYKEQLNNILIQKKDLAPAIRVSFFEKLFRKLGLFSKQRFIIIKNKYLRYYEETINKDSELIVVVGGGIIKFKYQNFAQELTALMDFSEKYNVPVIMNAVGVEGFDEKHIGCKLLKRSINKAINKAITTRDDIELLKNKWLQHNKNIYTKLVADPAVWANEVYGIEKDINSEIIGIGLIRGKIFEANEIKYSEEDLLKLYANILEELEIRKLPYKLFINGSNLDYDFAVKFCRYINKEYLINELLIPNTAEELIKIISGFKGIIAARLHACIVAYSLNVPAIGLVWNDKLSLFGSQIGYRERFIETKNFNAKKIVDKLKTALQQGYDTKAMTNYKITIKDSVKEILQIVKQ